VTSAASITGAWFAHKFGDKAHWVSLLLAALITLDLVRIAWPIYRESLHSTVRSSEPMGPPPAPRNGSVDVHRIVGAHLFGIAAKPGESLDPALAQPARADLALSGTIATDDPKHGFAIIGAGGPVKVYAVGDAVGDASLNSVFLEHVLLLRDGVLEILKLPLQHPSSKATLARGNTVAGGARNRDGGGGGFDPAQGQPAAIVAAGSNSPDQAVRLIGAAADGKLGFRVFPGRNRSAFAAIGLQAGDVVTSVNGEPVDGANGDQQVRSALTTPGTSVTVQRGKQTKQIVLGGDGQEPALAQSDASGQP
jgi:general secretion pathway protein C